MADARRFDQAEQEECAHALASISARLEGLDGHAPRVRLLITEALRFLPPVSPDQLDDDDDDGAQQLDDDDGAPPRAPAEGG